jgi:hypothetical protein
MDTLDSFSQFFDLIAAAAKSGSWMYLVAAVLMASTWGFRKYALPSWPAAAKFFATDAGGVILPYLLAFFGALVTMGPTTAFSGAVLWTAAKLALAAAGGYTAVKKAVWPALLWLAAKIGLGSAAAKIKDAEAVGVAAVAAKPSQGVAKAGSPTDVK